MRPQTKQDAFSRCHPLVNFLFFVGAIGFGVVVMHPAYLIASLIAGTCYYLLLHGMKGLHMVLALLPLAIFMTLINPIFNRYGSHVLFLLFGRPYTLEALLFGLVLAGMFMSMMMWFGCYNAVLTSDKFICLFGSLMPAISMMLVMVLRLIPNLIRKSSQIAGARRCIGKGAAETDSKKEKLHDGMTILSSLTDWALEGSVVTGDSMRSRGYGCAKRTSFQIYRMKPADWVLLALCIVLPAAVIAAGNLGASFTPVMVIPPLSWGFAVYCVFLLIPIVLEVKEALTWRILISRI